MATNSRAVSTRTSNRRAPSKGTYKSGTVANRKPINLNNISGYVDKAIELSKNPLGRMAIKTIAKQYAGSTGIDGDVFATAALNFIDEIRENSSKVKTAKSNPMGIGQMIAGLLQ